MEKEGKALTFLSLFGHPPLASETHCFRPLFLEAIGSIALAFIMTRIVSLSEFRFMGKEMVRQRELMASVSARKGRWSATKLTDFRRWECAPQSD
ncbi:hypothetical protein AVEN_207667-1 [Araneus ventricosus]|uniref:Uncharacterized protein n=1 Tax=Araneus ventricosus TaxID=182803 RepID=A0A4Y2KW27_ARAVE|nr:hypothetical protein AVEN_207667-1 [Araneus ventricosus]